MSGELTSMVVDDVVEKMAKVIDHVKAEFAAVRTGRANPAIVEGLQVEYFGTFTPLKQLAGFSVPDARLLVISPYDKGSLGAIEKAITSSDLGMSPSNDGNVIRLSFPPLTEERRKEYVKVVKTKAEEGRVQLRNLRRHARSELEGLEKDASISSDEVERVEKQVEQLVKDQVSAVDELVAVKEKELLEV